MVRHGRKNVRDDQNNQENTRKRATQAGDEHVSKGTGVVQRAKAFKAVTCAKNCNKQCGNLTEDRLRAIFQHYWKKLANITLQRNFLLASVTQAGSEPESSRKGNLRFFFENEAGIRFEVCGTKFYGTLDISKTSVYTTLKKRIGPGNVEKDMRGKHNNKGQISDEIKAGVINFINAIPRVPSHYCRQSTTKEYIHGDTSISQLYRDYSVQCEENEEEHCTESYFRNIFTTEFNIGFNQPKKDCCDVCEAFRIANAAKKGELQEDYDNHLLRAAEARAAMQARVLEAKADPRIRTSFFDLESLLVIPRGNLGKLYYNNRVNTCNLTIVDLANDLACESFFWEEYEGKRGADEIGSCLIRYVDRIVETIEGDLYLDNTTDNCGGQNKNQFIVSVYDYLLGKHPRIQAIRHSFLRVGHTMNAADALHSLIERNIAREIKTNTIYHPSQYVNLIGTCRVNPPHPNVTIMKHDDFIDTKKLAKDISINHNRLKISSICSFELRQSQRNTFFRKFNFGDNWEAVPLTKPRGYRTPDLELTPAYQIPPNPHSDKIKKEFADLIEKNLVPEEYEPWYREIVNS